MINKVINKGMKTMRTTTILLVILIVCSIIYAQGKNNTKQSAAIEIEKIIQKSGVEDAVEYFNEIKTDTVKFNFRENEWNNLGYKYLAEKKYKKSIAVFKMAVELFPKSVNIYDSLAEAYLKSGDKENARINYKIVYEKTQRNRIKYFLDNLDELYSRIILENKITFKPGDQTGITGLYFGQPDPGNTPQIFAPGIVSLAIDPAAACHFSSDGREIYFSRSGQIFFSKLEEKGWTFPEPLNFTEGLNSSESYLLNDNKHLLFTWRHPVPESEVIKNRNNGIWVTEKTEKGWTKPKYICLDNWVSQSNDGQIYVGNMAKENSIVKTTFVNDGFTTYEEVNGPWNNLYRAGHPTISPDGSFMIFDARDSALNGRILVSFKTKDNTWGEAFELQKYGIDGVNATISPDGKYLFYYYPPSGNTYWVGTKIIEDLRKEALKDDK